MATLYLAASASLALVVKTGGIKPDPSADWRSTAFMAKGFKTYNDVANATTINGLEWSVLEARARPCNGSCVASYATSDNPVEGMTRSNSGFVAGNETLRRVLLRDWELVHSSLKTTHSQLASHLRAVLQLAPYANTTYDVNSLNGNTLTQHTGPQTLYVEKQQTNGYQVSLFWNSDKMAMAQYDGLPFDDEFDCTYTVKNVNTGRRLPGLGAQCFGELGGQVAWIDELGFYEGSIEYRVDPVVLWEILTGSTRMPEAESVMSESSFVVV